MFVYTYRQDFWHQLHPVSIFLFCTALILLAIIFSHPLYLLVLAVAAALGTAGSGGREALRQLVRLAGPLGLAVVLFNLLIGRSGHTALVSGWPFTLEALVYGMVMAVRLFTLLAGWSLFSLTVRIEEILGRSRLFAGRAGLAVSLGVRLFPLLLEEQRRITEAMRSRGVWLARGRWFRRVENSLAVWQPLLLNTLERSWQLGEAMMARGFAGGCRHPLYDLPLQPLDFWLLAGLAVAGGAAVASLATGAASFAFYPVVDCLLKPAALRWLPFLAGGFLWPAFLAWRWQRGLDRDS